VALVDEWIDKAEADYAGAVALKRQRKAPLPDLVCYHCQQSAEKYLKAFLVMNSSSPPHIHHLPTLVNQCSLIDPALNSILPLARALDPYSVTTRYPGVTLTPSDADTAVKLLRSLRKTMRKKLGK
jgi:HEPN domain-containing protein